MFSPKSWCCYTVLGALPSIEVLQQNIEQNPHVRELDKTTQDHTGFIAPPGALDNQMSVLIKGRFLIFNVLHQQRKVPPAVIQEKMDAWRQKYMLDNDGEPPKGTLVREMKEQFKVKLAPYYPPDKKRIGGALDTQTNRLYWSENKPAIIENANNLLRGNVKTFRYLPGFAPNWGQDVFTKLFTSAFANKDVEPLLFGESVKLVGPEKESVSASNVILEHSENLQKLIQDDGFEVAKIALFTKTRFGYASYTIDAKQTLSKWKLLDDEMEAANANAMDDSVNEQAYAHLDSLDKTLTDLFELAKQYGHHDPIETDKATPELSQGHFGANANTEHKDATPDTTANLYDEEPELPFGEEHALSPEQQAQNIMNKTTPAATRSDANTSETETLSLNDDETLNALDEKPSLSLVSGGESQ